ncbi:MAG: hypothetical protein V4793_05425 [Paraburkholderia tropica]
MYSRLEYLPIIAVPTVGGWIIVRSTLIFHHAWIAYVGIGALIVIGAAFALLDRWIRHRAAQRAANERLAMQTLYPSCHVTRLSNGTWFLTDRATGREYRTAREGANHS